jgi:glycosyltransferase involved in cell wall biosynthesis
MSADKILIITTGNFPFGGCTANFVRLFSNGLSTQDIYNEIIILKGNERCFRENSTIDQSISPSHHFIFSVQPRNFFLKLIQFLSIIFIFPFYLLIKIIRRRYSYLILYGIEYPYFTIPMIVVSKIVNIKCFRIITDYYSIESVASTWWRKPKWFFYKLQLKYLDRYFNGLIVLSDLLKEMLIKNHVDPKKILSILHFIDQHDFDSNIAVSEKVQNGHFNIGYFGTISHANGVDVLLEAFRSLSKEFNNLHLVIGGDLNYEKGFSEKISHLRDEEHLNIIAPGYLSREDLKIYIDDCQVLINPRMSGLSADAGFPTKVGEYMSSGKPVIVTAVGYFKNQKFPEETAVVVIQPDSPEALSEGIKAIISNYNSHLTESRKNKIWVNTYLDYIINSQKVYTFMKNR